MRGLFRWFAVGLVTAALAGQGAAADRYAVSVFAAETVPFRSTQTHTFVVAVRLPESGAASEVCHISWCPANLKQRGLTVLPERGVNLPVADTFALCRARGMRVSMWGPYWCDAELFEIVRAQAARLESGAIRYKPTDNLYHPGVAVNCYHAIWHPIAPCRKLSGPFNCGDASGGTTVALFRPWLTDPCRTCEDGIGLVVPAGEPIIRRAYDDRPTRLDVIRSAVKRSP